MKLDPRISEHLKKELFTMTNRLMSYHQLALPCEDMYRELMPDKATYHIMRSAVALIKHREANPWDSETISLLVNTAPGSEPRAYLTAEFIVKFPSTKWILPESLAVLTPESTLGKKLTPMLNIANDLANLNYLFDNFLTYMPYTNVLTSVFPWVKDVIRDIKHEEGYNLIRFMNNYNIRRTDSARKQILHQLNALLTGSGGHAQPLLTDEMDRVCRYGSLAMTQYRVMKDADEVRTPQGYAVIFPVHNKEGASEKIRSDFALIRDYYNGKYDAD